MIMMGEAIHYIWVNVLFTFQIAEEGKEKDEKTKSGQDVGKEQSEIDENHFKSSGKDQDQAV